MYTEKTVSRKEIYKGNIIKLEALDVELFNGRPAKRDVVFHPGASVIIPVTEDGMLYMVKQYRKPIEDMLLELPAGKLDNGEDPYLCAERELSEETGLKAAKLSHLISIHTTPGFCNEVIHVFLATGLEKGEVHTDDDEFLLVEKLSIRQAITMVLNGQITDAKTIIGVFLAERYIKQEPE